MMRAFRNKMLFVPDFVYVKDEASGHEIRKNNPDMDRLYKGTFEPPAGWRAVSLYSQSTGVILLLEQEIIETPYR